MLQETLSISERRLSTNNISRHGCTNNPRKSKANSKVSICSRMLFWNWLVICMAAVRLATITGEEVVTDKMQRKGYQFTRGKRDPTVYTCAKTGATIVHHVDDLRVTATDVDLEFLLSKHGLGEHLDMKVGKIESPGTKVNVLSRTKVRTQDAFFTLPEDKHRDNILTLLDLWHAKPSRVAGKKIPRTDANTKPIDDEKAVIYPKCAIYLSIDRRAMRYEVKELARHMKEPREVDWENLLTLGRYLLHKPNLARVETLNPESKASGVLTVDGYTDSDWAGCLDTRCSSDCSVVVVVGSVVIAHPQTQPRFSATSSGEAETRALSRRETSCLSNN